MSDFDKVMKGYVNGWTSYLALQRVLMRWHEISGSEYAEWLASCLMTDPALMQDWANSLAEAIDERGENNTSQAYWTERPLPEDFLEKYRERREKREREKEQQK